MLGGRKDKGKAGVSITDTKDIVYLFILEWKQWYIFAMR